MRENWIIPCNVKFFDVIEHFEVSKTVIWKNAFTIHKDDTVYIYLGSPYSEIKYKCKVISTDISDEELHQNEYAIPRKSANNYFSKKEKYMKLELVCEFLPGTFKLEDLRKHGLGQVQIQARTDQILQSYINDLEAKNVIVGGDA